MTKIIRVVDLSHIDCIKIWFLPSLMLFVTSPGSSSNKPRSKHAPLAAGSDAFVQNWWCCCCCWWHKFFFAAAALLHLAAHVSSHKKVILKGIFVHVPLKCFCFIMCDQDFAASLCNSTCFTAELPRFITIFFRWLCTLPFGASWSEKLPNMESSSGSQAGRQAGRQVGR